MNTVLQKQPRAVFLGSTFALLSLVFIGMTHMPTGLQAQTGGPEIQVLNGATDMPDTTGLAMFGSTPLGTSVTRTFTVKNLGSSNLSLTQITQVPNGFSLVQGLNPLTLAQNATGSFIIRLNATSISNASGSVSFGNNDSNENPFDFRVSGSVTLPPPEIKVSVGSTNIFDGTGSLSFGRTVVGNPSVKTIAVKNVGSGSLTVTQINPASLPNGYSILSGGGTGTLTLTANSTTYFIIQLNATSAGTFSGPISFANNDSNENPFNFTISGSVTPAPAVYETVCGNGIVNPNYGEQCDDYNRTNGDGCSETCKSEQGWLCGGATCDAMCGDSYVQANEQGDDGNGINGDGCDTTCKTELGFSCTTDGYPPSCNRICGGNTGITCRSVCGNGVVEESEQCDNGNITNGDGCSSLCKIEQGYGLRQEGLLVTATGAPLPSSILRGQSLTYSIAAKNVSGVTVTNVRIFSLLAGGASFVSATASNGATCYNEIRRDERWGGHLTEWVTCGNVTLAPGASFTATITERDDNDPYSNCGASMSIWEYAAAGSSNRVVPSGSQRSVRVNCQ